MLYKITLLTAFLVAVIYPLCFWVSWKEPLKGNFHRFHLGFPAVLAGLLTSYILFNNFAQEIQWAALAWCVFVLAVAGYYWQKETPNTFIVSVASLVGGLVYILLHHQLLGQGWEKVLVSFLGGFIFCAALFAMNLGHWYLNVHGLNVVHLVRSTKILAAFLSIRLLLDAFLLFLRSTNYQGDTISLYRFLFTLDGFLLWLGIFFGVIFPLIATTFVLGTLKVKSTQSATGILYVLLSSLLIGDITYKYYAIKFNIYL